MRSIPRLKEEFRGIASLEIRTKILRRIRNYLLVMGYLTPKFVRFLQKSHLSFEFFEGNSFENSKGNSKRCDLDCARMVAGSRHLEILVQLFYQQMHRG